MDKKINIKRLYQYLNLRYVPSSETIVEGVKLDIRPPRVDASQIRIEQRRDLRTKIPKLFSTSIDKCLAEIPSGKEIGVFISGGLDSTIILHFLAQREEYKIHTFTMGFGEENDELEDARVVSDFYSTTHHEIVITNIMKDFAAHVKMFGFPKRNLWGAYLAEFAKQYVDVVFDGLGGDELFGGYTFRYKEGVAWSPKTATQCVAAYVRSAHPRDYIPHCAMFGHKFEDMNVDILYEPFISCFNTNLSFLDQFFVADLNIKCAYDFIPLLKLDKIVGLTVHTPWLSQDMIDLAFSVPYQWKVQDRVGKWILRQIFKHTIPDIAIEKRKQGFGMNPITVWQNGLRSSVEDILVDGIAVRDGYINPTYLKGGLILESDNSMIPHYNKVWDALAFEIWYREWLKE